MEASHARFALQVGACTYRKARVVQQLAAITVAVHMTLSGLPPSLHLDGTMK
jgi:hypothetical protein